MTASVRYNAHVTTEHAKLIREHMELLKIRSADVDPNIAGLRPLLSFIVEVH